jgi:hypothetical protein
LYAVATAAAAALFLQGLGVSTVGELAAVPLPRLEALVGLENAAWLQRLAQVGEAAAAACVICTRCVLSVKLLL